MGNKKIIKNKAKKITGVKKPEKKILEYYYMTPEEVSAKELSLCITAVSEEQIEVWLELNLMEVVMENDSLIFQDAREFFIDPLDQEYFQEHGLKSMYQISFDSRDIELVKKVMMQIMEAKGGKIYSDTDDFEPSYDGKNIEEF